ncbi:hypothetical protein D3C72_1535000 [compost metagenome]
MCTLIQMMPSRNSHGRSSSASRSICMPMQAIRKYRNTVPRREAPAASSRRARVKLRVRPIAVDSRITQTNWLSRLNWLAQLTLALNQPDNGAAMAWARPTPPSATPTITIRSVMLGIRAFCAS